MTYGSFETPLFYVGENYVSIFGLLGASVCSRPG